MTHKLGKELTFGLIYDSDWSVFSVSKPLVFWPTNTNRSFLHYSTLISAAPEWSHYSSTWGQHAWQIFHILAGPLGSLASILKLFAPENPLANESWVMLKKHALSPAFQDTAPDLLPGASTSQCSTVLEIRFAFLLLLIQEWHHLTLFFIFYFPYSSTWYWSGFPSYLTWISVFHRQTIHWIFIFNLIDHILWRGKLCYQKQMAGG